MVAVHGFIAVANARARFFVHWTIALALSRPSAFARAVLAGTVGTSTIARTYAITGTEFIRGSPSRAITRRAFSGVGAVAWAAAGSRAGRLAVAIAVFVSVTIAVSPALEVKLAQIIDHFIDEVDADCDFIDVVVESLRKKVLAVVFRRVDVFIDSIDGFTYPIDVDDPNARAGGVLLDVIRPENFVAFFIEILDIRSIFHIRLAFSVILRLYWF